MEPLSGGRGEVPPFHFSGIDVRMESFCLFIKHVQPDRYQDKIPGNFFLIKINFSNFNRILGSVTDTLSAIHFPGSQGLSE